MQTTAAALAPTAHFNVTTLRHKYFLNEQRMRNAGNASPESYRAHVYDTIWSAAVRPDGTLRAMLDTSPGEPVSAHGNPPYSGLKLGNRIFNQAYRLADVMEPQQAIGLLWTCYSPNSGDGLDVRSACETLRNASVPLSAMIGTQNLLAAPKTGAAGLIYLLPPWAKPEELENLAALARRKFPIIVIAAPGTEEMVRQLPKNVKIVNHPPEWTVETASAVAKLIKEATGDVLNADDGTCVYGFRAQGRAFVIVQNMWAEQRRITLRLKARTAGMERAGSAVDLNDNMLMAIRQTNDIIEVAVPVRPWDAALVLLAPEAVDHLND